MKCNFCEDIFQKNKELGLPEEETILYQDDNIYVMPDISPLAVGHLLIISKRHFQGFASADKETMSSLKLFLQYYRKRIKNRVFTVFEHGAVIPYSAGASIDHAHMHIMPFEICIKENIEKKFGRPEECNLEDLKKFKERMQPYFFYMKNGEVTGWAFEVNEVPSQILRKIANQTLGKKSNYNWKEQYICGISHINFYKTLAWWNSLTQPDTFKWRKKLLLEKYGLTDYKSIISEVNRFSREKKESVSLLLDKEVENGESGKIYRVILVPLRHQYQLPNYIITDKKDLQQLEEFYKKNPMFDEIWYLSNRSDDEGGYSGRISISKQGEFWEYIIEMVLGDNLRNLEKFSLGEENVGYFRAKKGLGNIAFQIEENRMKGFKEEILSVFEYVKREIYNYSENIRLLCECIQQRGIRVISIDFRVEDKKMVFIDWDTADDEKILKYELN